MADSSSTSQIRGERSESASKRKRVAIACVTCRARKARCDGRQPCSSCTSMGFQCVFAQSESSSNVIVGREYMSDLENRLQALEHAFVGLQPAQSLNQSESTSAAPGFVPSTTSHGAERVDVAGRLLLIAAPNQLYFGPSSTIAFTREVFAIIADMSAIYPLRLASVVDPLHQNSTSGSESERWSGTTTPSHLISSIFNDQARELVLRYFDNFGSIVPVVHRRSFLERFEIARNRGPEIQDESWLALLNMILALSIVGISGSAVISQDRVWQASAHQEASQQILQGSSLPGLSLSIVQCRLLAGYFFKSTRDFVRAWDECNAAIQGAMHLGLLSSGGTSVSASPGEAERNTTWLAIVQLHRALCIAFGRPIFISNDLGGAKVLQGLNDLNAPRSTGSRADMLSSTFFSASRVLSDISCTVVEEFYGNNATHECSSNALAAIQPFLNLNKRLSEWAKLLPSSLSLISSQDLISSQCTTRESCSIQRFRTLLSLRYLNIQLLLYRPLCMRFVKEANGERMDLEQRLFGHLQSEVLERAFESSGEIIKIVYALSVTPLAGSWLSIEWGIPVHYVFNAALTTLVVLAAHLSPAHNLSRKVDVGIAETSIEHAVAALEWLSRERTSCSVEIGFLRNSLVAISSINMRNETAAYFVAGQGSTARASGVPYYQPEDFAIDDDPTNIYRDLDIEGFLDTT